MITVCPSVNIFNTIFLVLVKLLGILRGSYRDFSKGRFLEQTPLQYGKSKQFDSNGACLRIVV